MTKSVNIVLDGTQDDLTALFSYSKDIEQSGLTTLQDYIAHSFNQTLERDGFYGAWGQVLKQDNGQFVLKMYSPHHDLNIYEKLVPEFLAAGKVALSIYNSLDHSAADGSKDPMRFLLPTGLCMAKTRSIQLLHFPPLETLVYHDYLYSPTNRRWENLLGYNHLGRQPLAELETIVDCVPIAALGDDMKGIAKYNNSFTAYVKQMLKARLSYHPNIPVVAYGGPVMQWLNDNFADQIKDTLNPLSLIELDILNTGVKTNVLCANHPSKYLYYTDDHDKVDFDKKKEMMTQDLISAGWQLAMVHEPGISAYKILENMKDRWIDNPQVLEIMKQEDESYGYKLAGWSTTLDMAQI